MPNSDLPGTLETAHSPVVANASQQKTIAQEKSASTEAVPVLDLRGYELLERLGGGGMGDVYRAGDPALGRDLAVKVMKPDFQENLSAQSRFLREARVTGSLQHPGIVPIYNLGRLTDGRLHYTMRLVRGRTFADVLKEEVGRPERLPALLAIFEKICQAVAYAHSKRVIHRDLKPSNVMVGRFGEVQVMDWGLAKLLTLGERGCVSAPSEQNECGTRIHTGAGDTPSEQTRMGREMGTPSYMPPEQALGEWDSVDERADVFALGAILCKILTGQPPYCGDGIEAVLRKAKRGDCVEALARLAGCGADAALLGLCRECLTPAREGRPRDAGQVAQRAAAYQAEVQQRLHRAELERAAALVQAREERKRRRWMWSALLLLLAGAAVSTWQAVRATNAESLARENEGWALTAAKAERQANDLATTRLAQIEKANEVLTSIFHDLDPRAEDKGGPNLRQQLSQHLERAATQLDEAAIGDAAAAARLQIALGESLADLGQTKLAIELLSKAGTTLEAKLGADHPDTLNARSNLASAYYDAGRLAEAIRLHEQTLKQCEAKLGADHPDTLTSRNNLAIAYNAADRIADAIRLHEQTLKQREAKLGADHPNTLTSRHNLALAYEDAGRTTEAIRLHERNIKQMENKLGADHPNTLLSMANLGMTYRQAGRLTEAIPLLETALQRGRQRSEGLPASIAWVPNALAQTYDSAGQVGKAEAAYRDALAQAQQQFGSDDLRTASALILLGGNLVKQKKNGDAEPLLRQSLTIRQKKQPDAWNTFNAQSVLGEALLGQKKYAEAEPLLVQGYEELKQRQDKIPAAHRQLRLSEALERLVRLYEARDQKDKAADWRIKLEEAKAAQKKPKS